jgi:hypothetical protein
MNMYIYYNPLLVKTPNNTKLKENHTLRKSGLANASHKPYGGWSSGDLKQAQKIWFSEKEVRR